MLGWFRALMPKEERFFDLFTRHAQVTLAAAEALRALLKGGDNVPQCCREITKRENEADEITREVLTALRRTFITPLDRGDIKDLITSMDDAIDQMNQTTVLWHPEQIKVWCSKPRTGTVFSGTTLVRINSDRIVSSVVQKIASAHGLILVAERGCDGLACICC
jgi:Protein of unknown function DUF47